MKYFEFNIGDWGNATAHLSATQEAFYFRLIRIYYGQEKPLPANHEELYWLVRAKTKSEKKDVDLILKYFFRLAEDGYHNNHCDDVIAKFATRKDTAKENGKKGGRPRKVVDNTVISDEIYDQNKTQEKPKQNLTNNQITINQEPKDKEGDGLDAKPVIEIAPPASIDVDDAGSNAVLKNSIAAYCRSQGIQGVANMRLENAIREGVTMQHMVDAVSLAKSRGKASFDYIVATARGLLKEEKMQTANPPQVKANANAGFVQFDPHQVLRDLAAADLREGRAKIAAYDQQKPPVGEIAHVV